MPFPAHVWEHIIHLLKKVEDDSTDSGHLACEIRIPSSDFFSLEELPSGFFYRLRG